MLKFNYIKCWTFNGKCIISPVRPSFLQSNPNEPFIVTDIQPTPDGYNIQHIRGRYHANGKYQLSVDIPNKDVKKLHRQFRNDSNEQSNLSECLYSLKPIRKPEKPGVFLGCIASGSAEKPGVFLRRRDRGSTENCIAGLALYFVVLKWIKTMPEVCGPFTFEIPTKHINHQVLSKGMCHYIKSVLKIQFMVDQLDDSNRIILTKVCGKQIETFIQDWSPYLQSGPTYNVEKSCIKAMQHFAENLSQQWSDCQSEYSSSKNYENNSELKNRMSVLEKKMNLIQSQLKRLVLENKN